MPFKVNFLYLICFERGNQDLDKILHQSLVELNLNIII